MKSKLKFSAAVGLFLVSTMTYALAQQAPRVDPATGLPVPQMQTFDPMTGTPIASGNDWKDPNWKDPDIILTNVAFEGLPIHSVADYLKDHFNGQFDVLLPGSGGGIAYVNNQTIPIGWQHEWREEGVDLRLRNVTASEIFSAMNMLFENNRTPLRWELKLNGHRQIAFLRVLIEPTPQVDLTAPVPGQEKQRRVYFVGDLIGDEKNGGMSMEQIIKTVTDVWEMADASGGHIQFHKEAQLLVVTGTVGQIDFMEQTLKALTEKVEYGKSTNQQALKNLEQKVNQEKTNPGAPAR